MNTLEHVDTIRNASSDHSGYLTGKHVLADRSGLDGGSSRIVCSCLARPVYCFPVFYAYSRPLRRFCLLKSPHDNGKPHIRHKHRWHGARLHDGAACIFQRQGLDRSVTETL